MMIQRYHVKSYEGDESAPHEPSFNRFHGCGFYVLRVQSTRRLNTSSTATRLPSTFVACSGMAEG